MSNVLPPVTVGAGTTNTVLLPHVNAIHAVKLSNGSPFDLTISGFGGETVVPTGTEYMLYSEVHNAGQISIYSANNLSMPPLTTGIVNLVVYYEGDKMPPGTWPISIPAQVVTASVDIAQQIVSDGYAPGTNVVESQEMGAPGSNVKIDNQGTFWIAEISGGVMSDFIHTYPGGDGSGHAVIINGSPSGIVQVTNTLSVTGGIITNLSLQIVPAGYVGKLPVFVGEVDGSFHVREDTVPANEYIYFGHTGEITAMGANNIGLGTAGTDRNVLDYGGGVLYIKGASSINGQVPGGTNMFKATALNNDPGLSGAAGTFAVAGDIAAGTTNTGLNNNIRFPDGSKVSGYHGISGNSGVATNHSCNKQPQYWTAIPKSMAAGGATGINTNALTATQITITTGTGVAWIGFATTFN